MGPYWYDGAGHNWSFAIYQLPVVILDTDTVTFSTPASWGTCLPPGGTSTALPSVTLQTCLNYVGQNEPGVGYFQNMGPLSNQTIPVPGFGTSTPTLQLGYNAGWECGAFNYVAASMMANLLKNGSFSHIATADSYGNPLTISAAASCTFLEGNDTEGVDGRKTGVQLDTPTLYTFAADEHNPSEPMNVSLSVTNGTIISSGSAPGTLTDGVAYGKTWYWEVNYANVSVSYNLTLAVQVSTYTGGTYPANWTLQNCGVFQSPDTPQTNDPTAISQNVLNWFATPNGTYPYIIRWVDAILSYDGASNVVTPAELQSINSFSYFNPATTLSATLTEIRPYDLTVSPYAYFDNPFAFTEPSPGYPATEPLPYRCQPANIGTGLINYMNFSGKAPGGWFVGELVFSGNVPFHSGQNITPSPTTIVGLQIQSGSLTTYLTTTSAHPLDSGLTIVLTGMTTCAFTAYWGGLGSDGGGIQPVGAPQYISNVYAPLTGLSNSCSVDVPDDHTIAPQAAAGATYDSPGTNLWLNVSTRNTQATIEQLATQVLNTTTPGRQIWIQCDNETYLSTTTSPIWMETLGQLGAWVNADNVPQSFNYLQGLAAFAGDTKRTFQSIFGERSGEIKLLISSGLGASYGDAGSPDGIYNVNIVNAAIPGQCLLDGFANAPYISMPIPSGDDGRNAPSLSYLWASLYPNATDSLAYGTAYPVTREQICDVLRHHAKYSLDYNGGDGFYQNAAAAIQLYDLQAGPFSQFPGQASQTELPIYIGYEGSYSNIACVLVDQTTYPDSLLTYVATHDLYYCPEQYWVQWAMYEAWQLGDLEWINVYCLAFPRDSTSSITMSMWGDYIWRQQPYGYGNGTPNTAGNTTVNQFYNFNGQGTATSSGLCQDMVNVSPRGQAYQDWMNALNAQPPPGPGWWQSVRGPIWRPMAGRERYLRCG